MSKATKEKTLKAYEHYLSLNQEEQELSSYKLSEILGVSRSLAQKFKKGYKPLEYLTENYEPVSNNSNYEDDFEEIAEQLNLEPVEVSIIYKSAMRKLGKAMKEDSKKYDLLRDYLNECEAKVVDSLF